MGEYRNDLLFGMATFGTLDDRARVLDEIIAKREAALAERKSPP